MLCTTPVKQAGVMQGITASLLWYTRTFFTPLQNPGRPATETAFRLGVKRGHQLLLLLQLLAFGSHANRSTLFLAGVLVRLY